MTLQYRVTLVLLVVLTPLCAATSGVPKEEEGTVGPAGDTSLTLVETLMSAGVMALVLGLSYRYDLGLETAVGVGTFRTIVQLSCLGYILEPVFATNSIWPVCGVVVFMLTVVAFEAQARVTCTYPGIKSHIVIATVAGVFLNVIIALCVVRPLPLYSPRYVIPLFGMLLGSSLTAVCLGLGELMAGLAGSAGDNVEMLLAHGATRHEALLHLKKQAVNKGIVPTINTMNVIGLVAIPGMMTGQILGGSSPMQAARYQMMILFLISSSACIVVITAVSLALYTLVDEDDCLRRDLLIQKKKEADIVKRALVWVGAMLYAAYEASCKPSAADEADEVEFVTIGREEE